VLVVSKWLPGKTWPLYDMWCVRESDVKLFLLTHSLTHTLNGVHCKMLHFCCILISQFWTIEILRHSNLPFSPGEVKSKVTFAVRIELCITVLMQMIFMWLASWKCACIFLQFYFICKNFVQTKNTCFSVCSVSVQQSVCVWMAYSAARASRCSAGISSIPWSSRSTGWTLPVWSQPQGSQRRKQSFIAKLYWIIWYYDFKIIIWIIFSWFIWFKHFLAIWTLIWDLIPSNLENQTIAWF